MIFWDASALVPLCVAESSTKSLRALMQSEGPHAGWLLSATEILSAVARRHREGDIDEDGLFSARKRRDSLLSSMYIVSDVGEALRRAERLLLVHPLRAADSLQLGAALIAVADNPEGNLFVTLDDRLGAAARREGFSLASPL